MENTRKIITDNIDLFPEFQYYIGTHILKIEENRVTHPDVAIETCKSLIEGISKTMIKRFEWESYSEEVYKKWNFPDLCLRMMKRLADYVDLQDDFITRTVECMRVLWNHRNDHGDISHGRVAPKVQVSTPETANLMIQFTEGVVPYLLNLYYSIDQSEVETMVEYNDSKFEDFNAMLDEENIADWISYSLALFEQDLPAYMYRYDEYVSLQPSNE